MATIELDSELARRYPWMAPQPIAVGEPDPNSPYLPGTTTIPQRASEATEGPSIPTVTGATYGHAPAGFSRAKWNNPAHTTPKYAVSRIIGKYGHSADGLRAAMPEIQALFPGARLIGQDVIDFGGSIGQVDVIQDVGGRNRPGWGVQRAGGGAASGRAGAAGAAGIAGLETFGGGFGGGIPGGVQGGFGGNAQQLLSSYAGQFTDPLTAQYEKLLSGQTDLYRQQQAQMQAETAQKQAVRAQTDEAVKKLLAFVNQRTAQLQQPAYTGREQEILRTQLLDPLERDRTASRSRALDNIGSRGFDPSSGIAQELFNQVDRGYDEQRATAQGELAYRQIQEERDRQREVQQLMQYAASVPEMAARGDLSFLDFLNDQVNQPGQQALATSALLADLPVQRTQLGAQILGLGGQPQSAVPNVLDLLQNAQTTRLIGQQQSADYWRTLGASF